MNREKNLETCLVITIGLIAVWFFYKINILLMIALLIGGIGLFVNRWATIINWAWYKLAEGLGFVMSKVLLSLVFFLFLLPLAILYRLFNKDHLQLKKGADTYWKTRNHTYTKKDLENIW